MTCINLCYVFYIFVYKIALTKNFSTNMWSYINNDEQILLEDISDFLPTIQERCNPCIIIYKRKPIIVENIGVHNVMQLLNEENEKKGKEQTLDSKVEESDYQDIFLNIDGTLL